MQFVFTPSSILFFSFQDRLQNFTKLYNRHWPPWNWVSIVLQLGYIHFFPVTRGEDLVLPQNIQFFAGKNSIYSVKWNYEDVMDADWTRQERDRKLVKWWRDGNVRRHRSNISAHAAASVSQEVTVSSRFVLKDFLGTNVCMLCLNSRQRLSC